MWAIYTTILVVLRGFGLGTYNKIFVRRIFCIFVIMLSDFSNTIKDGEFLK